jgi:YD repeat-containing protein
LLAASAFAPLISGCTKRPNKQTAGREASAVSFGLAGETAGPVTKPCETLPTLIRPGQGSGLCTGNFRSEITLPTLEFALLHNSTTSREQHGFGYGWNVSIDRRIESSSSSSKSIVTGDGTRIPLVYDSANSRWVSQHLSMSRVTVTFGSTIRELDDSGAVHEYETFGSQTLLVRTKFGAHATVELDRSSSGALQSITYPFGRVISFEYDASGDNVTGIVLSVDDEDVSAYELNYSSTGDLTKVVNPDQSFWEVGYSGNSYVSSLRTPGGETETASYFDGGVIESTTDPLDMRTTFAYTATSVQCTTPHSTTLETFTGAAPSASRLTQAVTDGVMTKYAYDSSLRVTEMEDHFGYKTLYSYGSSGTSDLPARLTLPSGKTTDYTYDTDHNYAVSQMTETLGEVTKESSFVRNADGYVTSETVGGITTAYNYDGEGNLTSIQEGSAAPSYIATYYSGGLVHTETNIFGDTITYEYDDGHVTSVIDPLGQVKTFTYDVFGNVTAETFLDGRTKTAVYDSVGRLLESTTTRPGSTTVIKQERARTFTVDGAVASDATNFLINGNRHFTYESIYSPVANTRIATIQKIKNAANAVYEVVNQSTYGSGFAPQPSPVPAVYLP